MRAKFVNLVSMEKEIIEVKRAFYDKDKSALILVTGDKALDVVEVYGVTVESSGMFIEMLYETGKLDLGSSYGIWKMDLGADCAQRERVVDYINQARDRVCGDKKEKSEIDDMLDSSYRAMQDLFPDDPVIKEMFQFKQVNNDQKE